MSNRIRTASRAAARSLYKTVTGLRVEHDANVTTLVDGGCFVEAQVWVPQHEIDAAQARLDAEAKAEADAKAKAASASQGGDRQVGAPVGVVVLLLALLAGATACQKASGEKVGTVTKLAREGFFCPTWEAQIIRGGLNGGSGGFGAPFEFTVPDKDVEALRKAMEAGVEVKVFYVEEYPYGCDSETAHTAVRIEPVQR